MEDRLAPSTVTVLNTHDSGGGSLRAALNSAHNGDTINFSNNTTNGDINFYDGTVHTITLSGGELLMKHSITIAGPGAGQLTVSGNHATRVFDLSGSTNPHVTMNGLTISNGYATGHYAEDAEGGGILNRGTLTINNCTLAGNSAGQGAAIHNEGTLTINGCNLTGNSGVNGAIQNYFPLTVNDSTISDNFAVGIWNAGPLTITGGTISGNHGGGIDSEGTAMISGTTLSGNYGSFGGIDNYGNGSLTLTNSTLINNSTAGEGGGVNVQGGTVTISGCTMTGNSAASGGAICVTNEIGSPTVSVSGCTLTGNSATLGGGIYISAGAVTVSNTSFSLNTLGNIVGLWTDGGGNTGV
jgi:predicted outer membrane repeat protein